MSIERLEGGKVAIACDACGEVADSADEFADAMTEFKTGKLKGGSVKLSDEWANLCGSCIADRKREMSKARR